MKKILCLLASLLIVLPVYAKDLNLSVKMLAIKRIKSTEISGDEIYISVTEFRSNDTVVHYTIPEQPLHWPERVLGKIENLDIWHGILRESQRTEVLLSVVDHDNPPLDADDLVGTVKLRMANHDGKLDVIWGVLGGQYVPEKISSPLGPAQRFTLTGDGGIYQVDFVLIEDKNGK